VYEHVGVEDYVRRGVEKLRNWKPVLIKIVFLIHTPYPVLFHGDLLKGFLHLLPNRRALRAVCSVTDK
jgi:hypothetical protein